MGYTYPSISETILKGNLHPRENMTSKSDKNNKGIEKQITEGK